VRRLFAVLIVLTLLVGSAYGVSVVLVEKRQAGGEGYPLESTTSVKLADGNMAQLITCCGVNRDDSAIYTVRDNAGYTVVNRKFYSGRVYLTTNGRLINFAQKGSGLEVTFYNHLLTVIREVNLVGVHSAAVGEKGSVAVLLKRKEGNTLRVLNDQGETIWEKAVTNLGNLFVLPPADTVAMPAADGLYLFTGANGELRIVPTKGLAKIVGHDERRQRLFLSIAEESGPAIIGLDLQTMEFGWSHAVNDLPAGHCRKMEVNSSRYLPKHRILALLLSCPGQRRMFYVARFLDGDGTVLLQQKLGSRVDASFYEIGDKVAISSDGYIYSFAVRQ